MTHMHYKGTGKMHSFRGLLGDGKQDRIRIQGSVGAIAWRITKFEAIPNVPGVGSSNHILKIYREPQSSKTSTVDLTQDELLAVGWVRDNVDANYAGQVDMIIFDNQLFVRNIYITHVETVGTETCNYYIELEEVKVSAAGMAQLAVAAARRTTEGGA